LLTGGHNLRIEGGIPTLDLIAIPSIGDGPKATAKIKRPKMKNFIFLF